MARLGDFVVGRSGWDQRMSASPFFWLFDKSMLMRRAYGRAMIGRDEDEIGTAMACHCRHRELHRYPLSPGRCSPAPAAACSRRCVSSHTPIAKTTADAVCETTEQVHCGWTLGLAGLCRPIVLPGLISSCTKTAGPTDAVRLSLLAPSTSLGISHYLLGA